MDNAQENQIRLAITPAKKTAAMLSSTSAVRALEGFRGGVDIT